MGIDCDLPSESLLLSQHRGWPAKAQKNPTNQHNESVKASHQPPGGKGALVHKKKKHLGYHRQFRAAAVALTKLVLMHFSSCCVLESAGLQSLYMSARPLSKETKTVDDAGNRPRGETGRKTGELSLKFTDAKSRIQRRPHSHLIQTDNSA